MYISDAVTGNDGTISCQQYCYRAGYNTCYDNDNVNCEKISGSSVTCRCANPNTVTTLLGNNGTISCDSFAHNNGYAGSIASYYNNTSKSPATTIGIGTLNGATLYCYAVKDLNDIPR